MKDNIIKIVYWEDYDCEYDIIIAPEHRTVYMALYENLSRPRNMELYEEFVNLAKNLVMEYAVNGDIEDLMEGVLNDQIFIFSDEADFNRFIMENL